MALDINNIANSILGKLKDPGRQPAPSEFYDTNQEEFTKATFRDVMGALQEEIFESWGEYFDAYNLSDQTINSTNWTPVSISTTRQKDSLYSTTTGGCTVSKAGRYVITGKVTALLSEGGAGKVTVNFRLARNGALVGGTLSGAYLFEPFASQSASFRAIIDASAGDTFTIQAAMSEDTEGEVTLVANGSSLVVERAG